MSQLEVDKIIPQSGTTLTIGDSGDTITVASGATLTGDLNADNLTSGTVPSARLGTITNFTSTGIDDNATSTAITIDADKLINLSGSNIVRSVNNSSFGLSGGNSSNVGGNITLYGGTSGIPNAIKFRAGSSETMRIDSSGNVLINTTDASTTTAGIKLRGDIDAIASVRDSNPSGYFGRLNSDGDILNFRKDSTTVGRIGVDNSDNLFISGNASHAGFEFGSSSIVSYKNGTSPDNTISLGGGAQRFKDLYLGGGVYLGGTGTANKLDDYEEGTWTPSYGFTGGGSVTMSSQEGHYVKIGKLVIATVGMSTSALSSPSGNAKIQGLPFIKEAISESGFSKGLVYKWGTNFNNFGTVVIDSTSYALIYTSAFNQTQTYAVEGSDFITGAGSNRIIGVITYYTTS